MSKKSDIHSQRAKKISESFSKSLKYPIDNNKAKKILLAAMHHDAGHPALHNPHDIDPK